MTVAELHARMSPREYAEWRAFAAWEEKEAAKRRREAERKRRRGRY